MLDHSKSVQAMRRVIVNIDAGCVQHRLRGTPQRVHVIVSFCLSFCLSHANSWQTGDLSPLHKTNVKSAIHNTIDYYAEITARGIVRGDSMIRDLPQLNALETEFD